MPPVGCSSPLLGVPGHLPSQDGIWMKVDAGVLSRRWGRCPVLWVSAGLRTGLPVCPVTGGRDMQPVPSSGVFDDMCC